ncbi:hypothetical protein ACHAW5_002907 [Stephanodiscus triporus]|uniref:Uncharacterized protein n=1 Tax=Stephanodiscus triporus TaxID=2934178 RepID=A0ABD3PX87_9STRA
MAGATTTRRRKIFPHLKEEDKTPPSVPEASKSAKGDSSKANGDATNAYNNSKQKEGPKHPSAAKKKPISSKSSDSIHGSVHHLLPLPLVLTVLVCSGLFWIASFRDVMATGKPILDSFAVLWGQDDADSHFLQYTKSTDWFEDSRGWKSKQGGLSTISSVTTDANNMGGLFIRKLSGVAGLTFHTTKIWPIVFQSPPQYDKTSKNGRWVGASWSAGHFDPLLTLGMIGDVCISIFYLTRLDELKNAGAQGIGLAFVVASLVESFIFGVYLLTRRMNDKSTQPTRGKADITTGEFDPLEDPDSLPSRIVARTVFIVSSLILVVSLRDLFVPGIIITFIPRDDIYLEWTGAFLHSPPPDTVEADENGLGAPLFAGDKFVSQLLGLYLSLGCMFKIFSAWGWSKGYRTLGKVESVDRSGVVSSKMIWKAQALGNMLLLGMLRLFTPAAKSASLDLRWHLMLVAYEAFILCEYVPFFDVELKPQYLTICSCNHSVVYGFW